MMQEIRNGGIHDITRTEGTQFETTTTKYRLQQINQTVVSICGTHPSLLQNCQHQFILAKTKSESCIPSTNKRFDYDC